MIQILTFPPVANKLLRSIFLGSDFLLSSGGWCFWLEPCFFPCCKVNWYYNILWLSFQLQNIEGRLVKLPLLTGSDVWIRVRNNWVSGFLEHPKTLLETQLLTKISKQKPCKNQGYLESKNSPLSFGHQLFKGGFPKGNLIIFRYFAPWWILQWRHASFGIMLYYHALKSLCTLKCMPTLNMTGCGVPRQQWCPKQTCLWRGINTLSCCWFDCCSFGVFCRNWAACCNEGPPMWPWLCRPCCLPWCLCWYPPPPADPPPPPRSCWFLWRFDRPGGVSCKPTPPFDNWAHILAKSS